MEIRANEFNKTISIPFVVNFTDDKEDLITEWVQNEGAGNINPIVDFEVDAYQYEGDTINYQFYFFCCGDDINGDGSNPYYPYNKQTIFTEGNYFINSFANTLRTSRSLTPTENQIIGDNIPNTNQWVINNQLIREVDVAPINLQTLKNSQFIFDYYNTNSINSRKKITNTTINTTFTLSSPDQFYFSKLIFTGETGQTNFNLVGYNAINYTSVLNIFPNFGNFYNIPDDVTYGQTKIPIISLNKLSKTLGNNIYLPKNNNITELYTQIFFYNSSSNSLISMVSKSGGTSSDILDTNKDGTIFLRNNYSDKYTYLKLIITTSTKTYGIRLYNPNTDLYDINPFNLTGGTVIPMYEKIISDVRVPGIPSNNLPPPTAG
jgi:hypothetical protein